MSSEPRFFLDTNVLVYQFDKTNSAKQARSQAIVAQGLADSNAIISTQVVQEFMNVALKKFIVPPSAQKLLLIMSEVLEPLCQHSPTFLYYKSALLLYKTHALSFYDALIIQAALDTNCQTLYSEDMQDGQTFGKLTIRNPFK